MRQEMGLLRGVSKQPRLEVRLEETIPQRPTIMLKTDFVNMPADQPQSKQRCHTVRVPSPEHIKQEGGIVLSKPTVYKLKLVFKKTKTQPNLMLKYSPKALSC